MKTLEEEEAAVVRSDWEEQDSGLCKEEVWLEMLVCSVKGGLARLEV